jgi:hypothetical protein
MSSFQRPHSDRLHNYRQDEEDGTKGSAFSSGMQSRVHVGKAVQPEGPDEIEEKANSYEYVAYYIERRH